MNKKNIIILCCALLGVVLSISVNAQLKFDTMPATYFYIKSVKSGDTAANIGYWNQPGTKKQFSAGDKIILDQKYNQDGGSQWYTFQPAGGGWYYILCQNGGYLDVSNGNNGDGVKMQVYKFNGSASQKFRIVHQGGGRYKIYTFWGRVLSSAGQNTANGSEIHTLKDFTSPAAEWYLYGVVGMQKYMPVKPAAIDPSKNNDEVVSENNAPKPVTQIAGEVYKLLSGEEFVYGKIGLFPDGNIKYNFTIVRKPNSTKEVFAPNWNNDFPAPLGFVGFPVKKDIPAPFEMFDYWIVFNGKKLGPYDYFRGRDSMVDHWVNDDGTGISFSYLHGSKYYYDVMQNINGIPRLGSIKSAGTWKGYAAAVEWGNSWRLYENGVVVSSNWKDLLVHDYLPDTKKILYSAGTEIVSNSKTLYFGKEKIAGPCQSFSQAGFLPGSEQIYYHYIKNGDAPSYANREEGVVIGTKRFIMTPDYSIDGFHVMDKKIVFYKYRDLSGKVGKPAALKDRRYTICEYEFSTGKMVTHGEYSYSINIHKWADVFNYDITDPVTGDYLIVAEGGKLIKRIPSGKWTIKGIVLDRAGHYYICYQPEAKHFNVKQPLIIEKEDGTVIYSGKHVNPNVKAFKINPVNGELQAVLQLQTDNNQPYDLFIDGSRQFTIKTGTDYFMKSYFAQTTKTIYSLQRTVLSTVGARKVIAEYELLRDSVQVGIEKWNSIADVAVSDDGGICAMKALSNINESDLHNNPTLHEMSLDWKLVVNGITRGGHFGNPVWVPASKKIMVLEQKGNSIVLSTVE